MKQKIKVFHKIQVVYIGDVEPDIELDKPYVVMMNDGTFTVEFIDEYADYGFDDEDYRPQEEMADFYTLKWAIYFAYTVKTGITRNKISKDYAIDEYEKYLKVRITKEPTDEQDGDA